MAYGNLREFVAALEREGELLRIERPLDPHLEIPEVIERFAREVREVNKNLGEFEQIKRFRLVTEEWTPQTGELSPTLKLRRNILTGRYQNIINEIYSVKEKGNVVEKVVEVIRNGVSGILKNLPKF